MTVKCISVLSLLALALLSVKLHAEPIIATKRCSEINDSLSRDQALGRTKWARKCYPDVRQLFPHGKETKSDEPVTLSNGGMAYPIFAKLAIDGSAEYWIAPVSEAASCDGSSLYSIVGFCAAGCLSADQVVVFGEDELPIGSLKAQSQKDIVTLDEGSRIDDYRFTKSPLTTIVTDVKPKVQEMVNIKTERGIELKVSADHPMLLSTGDMKNASLLKLSDKLVYNSGENDTILSLTPYRMFGQVYNVEIASLKPLRQVIVTQGYLTGSTYYQDQAVQEINRRLLRESLIGKLLNQNDSM